MVAVIEFADVTVRRGRSTLIDAVSWRVAEGERWVVLGPNGAGKTTLLLILASLLRPDRGQVRVAGIDPGADARGVRTRMGWMPDAFGVYDQLTVR